MLGKFGILVVLLILVLLFYVVISFGAGAFSKRETTRNKEIFKVSKNIVSCYRGCRVNTCTFS